MFFGVAIWNLVSVCVCYTHFHQQNLNVAMFAYVTSMVLLLMIEYPPLSSVDESYQISQKFGPNPPLKMPGVTVGLVWKWDTPAPTPQNPMFVMFFYDMAVWLVTSPCSVTPKFETWHWTNQILTIIRNHMKSPKLEILHLMFN